MSKSTQAVAKLQPSGWGFGVSVGSFWEPVSRSPKEAFGLECPAQACRGLCRPFAGEIAFSLKRTEGTLLGLIVGFSATC
jgi:hypothetical protein